MARMYLAGSVAGTIAGMLFVLGGFLLFGGVMSKSDIDAFFLQHMSIRLV